LTAERKSNGEGGALAALDSASRNPLRTWVQSAFLIREVLLRRDHVTDARNLIKLSIIVGALAALKIKKLKVIGELKH